MIDNGMVPRIYFSNKAVLKRDVGFATQDAAKIAGREDQRR
jgi:hypothetical protein